MVKNDFDFDFDFDFSHKGCFGVSAVYGCWTQSHPMMEPCQIRACKVTIHDNGANT